MVILVLLAWAVILVSLTWEDAVCVEGEMIYGIGSLMPSVRWGIYKGCKGCSSKLCMVGV